jgi:lambda repressor-like predicted transcriptional regulator
MASAITIHLRVTSLKRTLARNTQETDVIIAKAIHMKIMTPMSSSTIETKSVNGTHFYQHTRTL